MYFSRISELIKGDKFLYNGTWRIVTHKDQEKITFKPLTRYDKQTLGARSQQFVQVEPLNSKL